MSKRNIAAVIFFSIVAVFFIFTALLMHPFGVLDESGMDDYIPKPIKRELVFEMIEKWVLNKEVS